MKVGYQELGLVFSGGIYICAMYVLLARSTGHKVEVYDWNKIQLDGLLDAMQTSDRKNRVKADDLKSWDR